MTGGVGFIGSSVVDIFLTKGFEVVNIDTYQLAESRLSTLGRNFTGWISAIHAPGGIYNLGSGQGTSINQIFDHLRKIISYIPEAKHGSVKLGETRTKYLDA